MASARNFAEVYGQRQSLFNRVKLERRAAALLYERRRNTPTAVSNGLMAPRPMVPSFSFDYPARRSSSPLPRASPPLDGSPPRNEYIIFPPHARVHGRTADMEFDANANGRGLIVGPNGPVAPGGEDDKRRLSDPKPHSALSRLFPRIVKASPASESGKSARERAPLTGKWRIQAATEIASTGGGRTPPRPGSAASHMRERKPLRSQPRRTSVLEAMTAMLSVEDRKKISLSAKKWRRASLTSPTVADARKAKEKQKLSNFAQEESPEAATWAPVAPLPFRPSPKRLFAPGKRPAPVTSPPKPTGTPEIPAENIRPPFGLAFQGQANGFRTPQAPAAARFPSAGVKTPARSAPAGRPGAGTKPAARRLSKAAKAAKAKAAKAKAAKARAAQVPPGRFPGGKVANFPSGRISPLTVSSQPSPFEMRRVTRQERAAFAGGSPEVVLQQRKKQARDGAGDPAHISAYEMGYRAALKQVLNVK